jgi:hypothetical protein
MSYVLCPEIYRGKQASPDLKKTSSTQPKDYAQTNPFLAIIDPRIAALTGESFFSCVNCRYSMSCALLYYATCDGGAAGFSP